MEPLVRSKFLSLLVLEKYSFYFFGIITFSIAFYLQYSVAFLGLDLHHDLLMFDAARNLYSGQVPYKDFFYQYNLGTLLLHSTTLSFLGLKIASLKKITVLFYALIALFIYLSCAIEGYKRSGFLLSVLWALLSPFYMPAMNGYHTWSTVYMMFACMAGLFCLQLANHKSPLIFGVIAGVLFGLAFWFKQVAAYQIIAILIWLILAIYLTFSRKNEKIKYIRIFCGYAFGGLIVSIPFFAYLYSESAILDWWIDAFEFNKYFAADSQSLNAITNSLKVLFPISREMGYKSFIWAFCPLIVCIVAFQVFLYRKPSFIILKSHKEILALFLLAGVAGWLEYFPLPHAFHTQIFMAPTFVLVGLLLGKHPMGLTDTKKNIPVFFIIYLFIALGLYEGIRHIQGWNNKRLQYANDSIVFNHNSPVDGLKIDKKDGVALASFYESLLGLKSLNKDSEFLPLSVDPIRGLLPGENSYPSEYKMGVNWTWPNELVEPGFANKIQNQIRLRELPIYADSLIYIPGYIPVALLEMQAPISWAHTLYKPSKVTSNLINGDKSNNEILYATNKDFDIKSRSILLSWNSNKVEFNLIPIENLTTSDIQQIKNIHISILEESDFPSRLSPLKMDYLKKATKLNNKDILDLFEIDKNGWGTLRDEVGLKEKKNLALFMISSGTLFNAQNRPTFASTLSLEVLVQPAIVKLLRDSSSVRLLWSLNKNVGDIFSGSQNNLLETETYLAVPPLLSKVGAKFTVIQIEFQNGRVMNYFYSFKDEKK